MSPHRPSTPASRLRAFRRLAAESVTSDEGANAVLVGSVLILSCGFFGWVASTAALDPGYFERRLIAGMDAPIDPVMTGSVAKSEGSGVDVVGPAMPVPEVVRAKAVQPSDYTVVALFESEAVLAAGDELWRVKVGSILPGLGAVLAIEADGTGAGRVRTEKATLSASR